MIIIIIITTIIKVQNKDNYTYRIFVLSVGYNIIKTILSYYYRIPTL